ncbi:Carnitine O-acetyltransferase [Lamellibrachia satsuma]|nr:Carnitine O-acetyltransferase [Lamellibrachia satsuma]
MVCSSAEEGPLFSCRYGMLFSSGLPTVRSSAADEWSLRGDSCEEVRRDSCEEVRGDSCEEVRGDSCVEVRGDSCEEVRGDSCEEVRGDSCEEVRGDSCEEVRGDSCEEVRRDSCEEVRGDSCEEVRGDSCEEVRGDSCVEVRGDSCDEVRGDSHEEVMGNNCEEVREDICDDERGDSYEEVKGDCCEEVRGDSCEEERGDSCEEVRGVSCEEVIGDRCEEVSGDSCEDERRDLCEEVIGDSHMEVWRDSREEVSGDSCEDERRDLCEEVIGDSHMEVWRDSREELEEWWLNSAYLEYRRCVPINVSPGVVLPSQSFTDQQQQLRFAAKLIAGLLDYKVLIDGRCVPQEYMAGQPLCMSQYYKILNSCRVPLPGRDAVKQYTSQDGKHIVVIHNNHFFSVDVYGKNGEQLSRDQLYQQLCWVVEQSHTQAPPVGLLTADDRDTWAHVFKILQTDQVNERTLAEIQKSIFILNLDKAMPETAKGDERYSMLAGQMNHGGGSAHNTSNRWFDKTLQFVVGVDGAVGITYEHCAAEGPPVIAIVDHTFSYCQTAVDDKRPAMGVQGPTQLAFNVTPEIDVAIEQAAVAIDKQINNLELKAFKFTPFGKDFIKSQKLSPDAFVQVNLQLAYYRLHGRPTATYESGSLRKFTHGRTETIRSCSIDSHNYCLAMEDKRVSASDKMSALRAAVSAHSNYTQEVTNGQGIDRHLLGLKLLANENHMATPDFFKHSIYTDSTYWKLSTSQVPSKHDSLLCFGAVVPDGYGFCYNPMRDHMNFSVSAWDNCSETSAARFAEYISAALTDAQQLLLANCSQR